MDTEETHCSTLTQGKLEEEGVTSAYNARLQFIIVGQLRQKLQTLISHSPPRAERSERMHTYSLVCAR